MCVLFAYVNTQTVIWKYHLEEGKLFTRVLARAAGSGSSDAFFSRLGVKLHTGAKHHVTVYPVFIWHISARSHSATDSISIKEVFVTATLKLTSTEKSKRASYPPLSTSPDFCSIKVTGKRTGTVSFPLREFSVRSKYQKEQTKGI